MNADGSDSMTRLVGAMDLAGNPHDGNNRYMSLIVGTEAYLQSVIDYVGYDHIHMSRMGRKDQDLVVSRLKLDRKKCIALCVKIDKNITVDKIARMRKVKTKYAARKKVLQAYNRLLLAQIQNVFQDFLIKYRVSLSDVVFQCDSDCVGFAKDAHLSYENISREKTRQSRVYGLADAIAWENNRGREPNNVIRKDVTKTIETILRDGFSK